MSGVPADFIVGNGPHLVEASAGTGKTTWMVEIAVRLLLQDRGVPRVSSAKRLLAMTFTRAATAELKSRLREALRRLELALAGRIELKPHEAQGYATLLSEDRAAVRQRLATVIGELDQLSVTTIHGFCKGVLEEFALECGVPANLDFLEDLQPYLETAAADEWRALTWPDSLAARVVIDAIDADTSAERERWSPQALIKATKRLRLAIGAQLPPRLEDREASLAVLADEVARRDALWQDAVLATAERLRRALERDRAAGFDDMIAMVERALSDEHTGPALRATLRERYDAILVDEFQDTDWAQWRIFSMAFGEKPLVLVGDPKQSIYGFRGADILAYREARDAAGDRQAALTTNFRSDAGLVDATNALFGGQMPFRVPPRELAYPEATGDRAEPSLVGDALYRPLTVLFAGEGPVASIEPAIARFIADEIARLLSDLTIQYRDGATTRPLRARDIAVLVGSRYQGRTVLQALRKRKISAVSSATGQIAESLMWGALQALVAAVDAPADARAVRAALATPLGGRRAAELQALDEEPAAWRRIIDGLEAARREWGSRGAVPALLRLLGRSEWDARRRLAQHDEAERLLTDFRHLLQLLHQAEREGHRSPRSVLHWLAAYAESETEDSESRQQHLETDRSAVLVSTVHGAKGLEWPVVFCAYMWKEDKDRGDLPRLARLTSGARRVVFESDVPDEGDRDLPVAEGMRLGYVSLTRARSRLYVFDARGSRQKVHGPVGHLLHADGGMHRLAHHPHAVVLQLADAAKQTRAGSVPERETPSLAAALLEVPAERLKSWGVSSYTQLTSDAHRFVAADEPGPVDDPEAQVVPGDMARADQLPPGAHTGNALHLLFERLDFPQAGEAAIRDALAREVMDAFALPRAGATPAERESAAALMVRMVERTLVDPMPGQSWRLADVGMDRTLREWRFNLPARELSVARMADAFREQGAPWLAAYGESLRGAPSRSVTGFLTGVVDLVAQAPDGRWWIVDWKSNTLGSTAVAYDAEGCRDEMRAAQYVLQYHLYAVALHRFLTSRLRDAYDYERDFGGVGYAFLRGLAMGVPSWFVDRPSAALIAELDRAVGR